MALTSVFTVAKRANILQQVLDENVGTGNNSAVDFDLDQDNVITGSYTLSAGTSGANTFITLTEATHYTLDKPSGRVVLTSAGVTYVGTRVIYGNYYYLAKLTESQLDDFITAAEKRLRILTGRIWESESFTEYHDGRSRSLYPKTDRPFQRDRPEWDFLQLNQWPVTALSEVYFIDRVQNGWVEVHSDDGGSFTDNTTEANTVSGTVFNVFAATPAVSDAIYFGLTEKFLGLVTKLKTLGTDAGSLAVTWEYYNGSSWASLSNVTAAATGTNLFTASGKVTWDMPSAWAKTTVNSGSSLYFVRGRLSAGSYTAVPTVWEAWPDPNSVLKEEISLRNVDVDRGGRLTFLEHLIPDGVRNIRVKYTCGVASGDEEYQLGIDLANLLASLMAAVAITGGSFDDETRFELGSWGATIGEVYVNVAEVVKQITNEIAELKRLVGDRNDLV